MLDNSWTPMATATLASAIATLILAIAVALDPLLRLVRLLKSKQQLKSSQTTAIRDRRPLFILWLPLAGLALDVMLLINEYRSSAPLTRPRVLLIGILAATLLVIPLWMVITLLLVALTKTYDEILGLQLKLHDSVNYRVSAVEIISQGVLNLLIDANELSNETHAKLGAIFTKLETLREADHPPTPEHKPLDP